MTVRVSGERLPAGPSRINVMTQVQVLNASPDRSGGYKVDVGRGQRIGRVSSEWFSRPADERYLSLNALMASVKGRAERSRTRTGGSEAAPMLVSLLQISNQLIWKFSCGRARRWGCDQALSPWRVRGVCQHRPEPPWGSHGASPNAPGILPASYCTGRRGSA